MKLLIVDSSMEAQAYCAKRIEAFSQDDLETLDLKVKLVNEHEFLDRVQEADVLVLGSGLGERAISIARQATSAVPWIHVLIFVTDEAYDGGAFRAAHSVGIRRMFRDTASPTDFLQELVAIHAEFKRDGRAREGKVFAIAHAKGGVGATTVAGALSELCDNFQRRTMLWDLDVETHDLSCALTINNGPEAAVVSSWVNGSAEISRDSLRGALVGLSTNVHVLVPPDKMAESMDLVCHTDGLHIAQRIVQLARASFDVVLVDTGGAPWPGNRGRDAVGRCGPSCHR